jgi:hypothetical protein
MMIMGIKVEWATNLLLLIKINIDFYNESLYAILNLKTLKEKEMITIQIVMKKKAKQLM